MQAAKNYITKNYITKNYIAKTYKEDLANFLESLARSMRSGAGIKSGVEETIGAFVEMEFDSGLSEDLNILKERLNSGVLLNQALEEWSQAKSSLEVAKTKAVLTFGTNLGGQRARAFESLARSFRQEISIGEELYALTAQARFSALVIAVLPLGFLVIFSVLDFDFLKFLFVTKLGIICFIFGLLLDLTGTWWMKRILDKCV